jgi:ABC-type transport system substrate-binding protein
MRKVLIATCLLSLAAAGPGAPTYAQPVPVPRGELRVVDRSPANWIWITLNVMEHLMELDKDGQLVPRLATGWSWIDDRTLDVKLRRGVRFHNGEVFDAEIVKLNWEENFKLRQPHRGGTYMNFKPGSRIEIADPYTVRFIFAEPDGAALLKISWMHIGNREFYRKVGWGEKHW